MKVIAICSVRNAADTAALTIMHYLLAGVDEVHVLDNGSRDGTIQQLRVLGAKTGRVRLHLVPGPFDQPRLMTQLAKAATRAGADWIVPFDIDEIIDFGGDQITPILASIPADVIKIGVTNFAQANRQLSPSATFFRDLVYSVSPFEQLEHSRSLVFTHKISFLEIMYPPKVIFRANGFLDLDKGNHNVHFTHPATSQQLFEVLHFPVRNASELRKRALDYAPRTREFRRKPSESWQSMYFAQLAESGMLDSEWSKCSHLDGRICVNDRSIPLKADDRTLTSDPFGRWQCRPQHMSTGAGQQLVS